jgi:hypothetical protein
LSFFPLFCLLFLFVLWGFVCSCIFNFTITIFLSLFLPPLLPLVLLCYNPLFSLLTTLIYCFPHFHLSLLFSHNLSPHYHSLLHTHHPLTSILF